MTDDWLEIGEKPTLPATLTERVEAIEERWTRLTLAQKTFLSALRDHRFNARSAARELEGQVSRAAHTRWQREDPDYAFVVNAWQANAARDALDPDRLLVRQDLIVEEALTPKEILYQGVGTGHYEVNVSAASRANEVLLDRALPKNAEEKARVVVTVVRLTGENDPDAQP